MPGKVFFCVRFAAFVTLEFQGVRRRVHGAGGTLAL